MKVAISVPCPEIGRFTAFYDALLHSRGFNPQDFLHVHGANVAENRNLAVENVLKNGPEYDAIVHIDDDQAFGPHALQQLIAVADQNNCDVLSGLYLKREPPFIPHVYRRPNGDVTAWADGKWEVNYLSEGQEGLVRCDMVGAGFLLVRTRVYRGLEAPYWTLGQGRRKDVWADDEDFCRRVRIAGFTIWCDLDNRIGHQLVGTVWPMRQDDGTWVTALTLGKHVAAVWPAAAPEAWKLPAEK